MASKNKNNLWLIAALAICASALAFTFVFKAKEAILVNTLPVKKGPIQAYIDEQGHTSLPHIFHVTMPMQGRVLPMEVAEGEIVTKGQKVAKLEDADWRDARLEVESITSTFTNWLEASEAQLKAAHIRLEFDKWNWERHKQLAKNSAISEREQRNTKRHYLDSSVQAESSEAMFFATKAMQSIIDLLPGYVNRNFDRTTVTSPVTGTILKRHVWNEKMMSPGASLLDIGNLEELEVTAEILTEQAVHIHPGDKVIIYGASLGELTLEGIVRMIEPKAFTKVSSLGVEEQRVAVKIIFTEDTWEHINKLKINLGLKYRVRVKIITEEKEAALSVPRTALFYGDDGGWQLYRMQNGNAQLLPVKLGLLNDVEAEILSGLEEGDTIISVPQANIKPGIKVKSLK